MKLLFEVSHPAHVLRFTWVIRALADEGHDVLVLSRDTGVTLSLLDVLQIRHRCISRARRGTPGRVIENTIRHVRALMVALTFRPDLIVSAGSPSVIYAGWLLGVLRIVHLDASVPARYVRHFNSFADRVVTSESSSGEPDVQTGEGHVHLPSLETLAYLHPNVFTPDDRVLDKYGLQDVPFAFIRLVDDTGNGPLDDAMKRLTLTLERRGIARIVLSDESSRAQIENAITPAPGEFHHLLARASLCIGESINVANEAATLGVPAFLVSRVQEGNAGRLEREGLVRRFDDSRALVEALEQIDDVDGLIESTRSARDRLLDDMADMNACWLDVIRDALPNTGD